MSNSGHLYGLEKYCLSISSTIEFFVPTSCLVLYVYIAHKRVINSVCVWLTIVL